MQRFLRLAGFLGAAAGIKEEQAKNFQWGLRRTQRDQTSGREVVIGTSRPLSRVVTGVTVRITTVMDLTGMVEMTTTAATITTTTLAVTTGIPVTDVTKETGVISLTDLPILVLSNP
nr:zinc finger, CCHC-type, retrotransposon Gag domain protein [Tanacetum cinerariifolium]